MDKITKTLRSRNMSRIKSKDTSIEMVVRKALFSLGYKYRIHYPIPGKPDIVFPRKKLVIFIDGCFWHGHKECEDGHLPKTNRQFWEKKIKENKKRDFINTKILRKDGWRILKFYECEVQNNLDTVIREITGHL